MKASLSFPELQGLVTERTKQPISFSFVDDKTVKVTYALNLGFIKKDISANLIIKKLIGNDLLLQIAAGIGTDTMITTMLNLFKDKIPPGLIEKQADSHLILHLDKVEQMKAVFERIDITNLHVLTEGLEVEGLLKT